MKKRMLLLLAAICLICCKKKDETINNYTTVGSPLPAYTVNGISDITLVNDVSYNGLLTLTVQYQDSAQENVTLSVTGLPAGINMDNTWIASGIPTFSTTLTLFDTNAVGAVPGTYPLTLTATTVSGKKRDFPFNLKILGMPTAFLGKYTTCTTTCGGGSGYTDSVYADPDVINKIWFSNFANTGQKIYGLISTSEVLTIPSQTVGGITYYTTGSIISLSGHTINLTLHKGPTSCTLSMH